MRAAEAVGFLCLMAHGLLFTGGIIVDEPAEVWYENELSALLQQNHDTAMELTLQPPTSIDNLPTWVLLYSEMRAKIEGLGERVWDVGFVLRAGEVSGTMPFHWNEAPDMAARHWLWMNGYVDCEGGALTCGPEDADEEDVKEITTAIFSAVPVCAVGSLLDDLAVRGCALETFHCMHSGLHRARVGKQVPCGSAEVDPSTHPLHQAALYGHVDVVHILLHYGHNPLQSGQVSSRCTVACSAVPTPMEVAGEYGDEPMVNAMLGRVLMDHVDAYDRLQIDGMVLVDGMSVWERKKIEKEDEIDFKDMNVAEIALLLGAYRKLPLGWPMAALHFPTPRIVVKTWRVKDKVEETIMTEYGSWLLPIVAQMPARVAIDAIRAADVQHLNARHLYFPTDKRMTHQETTILHIAANHQSDEVLRVLLEVGVNASLTDYKGRSALMLPSTFGHLRPVQTLLAAGVAVDKNVTHVAASKGHLEVLGALLRKDTGPIKCWKTTSKGEGVHRVLAPGAGKFETFTSWLHFAVAVNDVELATLLLKRGGGGASDACASVRGRTALMMAVERASGRQAQPFDLPGIPLEDKDMVDLLLLWKADMAPRLPGGHSALSLALASQSQSPDGPADFSAVERLLLAYYSHAAIDAEGNYLHGAAAIKNVDNYFALEDLLYFISQVRPDHTSERVLYIIAALADGIARRSELRGQRPNLERKCHLFPLISTPPRNYTLASLARQRDLGYIAVFIQALYTMSAQEITAMKNDLRRSIIMFPGRRYTDKTVVWYLDHEVVRYFRNPLTWVPYGLLRAGEYFLSSLDQILDARSGFNGHAAFFLEYYFANYLLIFGIFHIVHICALVLLVVYFTCFRREAPDPPEPDPRCVRARFGGSGREPRWKGDAPMEEKFPGIHYKAVGWGVAMGEPW